MTLVGYIMNRADELGISIRLIDDTLTVEIPPEVHIMTKLKALDAIKHNETEIIMHLRRHEPLHRMQGLATTRKGSSKPDMTRLSLAIGYVRSEIGTLGCVGQPQPLRLQVKQV